MNFLMTANNDSLDYTHMFKHNRYIKPVLVTSYSASIDFNVNEYDILIFNFDGEYQTINVNFVDDFNSLQGKKIFIVNCATVNLNLVNANNYSMGAIDDKRCFKRGSSSWEEYQS